ncbi:MAG: hypothetical protein HYR98_08350 [Nitrospirae bacterium]|nr:hypothetical protein [Nitrospirota bacterium]MBI3474770.1 hypothetical protein [Acidobacteriota bacterium]
MGSAKTLLGNWRIIETELWDCEDLDLHTQAMLSLKPKGVGRLVFIAIEAQLDYRVVMRDGLPGIEFSFHGFDEGDEVIGRGWAILKGEQLQGRLFFHQGDDSSFVAQRQPNRKSPANIGLQPTAAGARKSRRR